jgi:DNA primase
MNVIDVLNDRQIKFREAGKDYQVHCLNPEHDDSNPSMRIDKVTGVYNCFSCGFKGNIFRLFGADPNYIDISIARLQDKIRDLLSNKNLTMPTDAVPFDKNYRGLDKRTYLEINAFTSNEEDEFKDRLMFPIYDIRGNIKVFVGRAFHTEIEDKYLVYPPNVRIPLFPAHPEIWKNSLIIVEGIFDALNLMDKGCYNVISAFGTVSLFKTYKEKLSHYKILGVNKFYIMFDGDKAGRDASVKLEAILNDNGFNAETIELPDGMDPGDLTEHDVSTLMIGLYGNEDSSS